MPTEEEEEWYGFIIKRHFKGTIKNFSARRLKKVVNFGNS